MSVSEYVDVPISAQKRDQKAQREQLLRFFVTHPNTIYSQETLADACGCAVSTVRSRISELVRDGHPLRWHQSGWRDAQGQNHINLKTWEYVHRPSDPIGRDAGDRIAQKELF